MNNNKKNNPLDLITELMTSKSQELNSWFEKKWQGLTPLPYFSCDIRHSSIKMAVVDTNLFPGGFNNLCNTYSKKAVAAFKLYFATHHPHVKKIALLAETHTRNRFYLENVLKLQTLINEAGLTCRTVMLSDELHKPLTDVVLSEAKTLSLYKPQFLSNKMVLADDFVPDLILSNNDFSEVPPAGILNLTIPIVPAVTLGWTHRKKFDHFNILHDLVNELSQNFSFDPWLLFAETVRVDGINADNLTVLATKVDELIETLRQKDSQYGIDEAPYIFVKSNSGTYGMGVISVNSGEEILALNRKRRTKLFSSKGGNANESFIIQEGIPTSDSYSDYPIEPVIYGIGKEPVGGFFRIHESKNKYESLNAPGMSFSCLCLHKLDEPHEVDFIDCCAKKELVSGAQFLARLAALAASLEAKSILVL